MLFVSIESPVFLIFCSILISRGQGIQPGCDSKTHWTFSGYSSCLLISTDRGPDLVTWQIARDTCVTLNSWSTLAALPTDEHDAVIARKARNSTAYWVGIQVPSNASRPYTWMDGTVETRNSIFPGNLTGLSLSNTSSLCGHVTLTILPAHRQLSWSFGDCLTLRPFICIVDVSHNGQTTPTKPTKTTPTSLTIPINGMAKGPRVIGPTTQKLHVPPNTSPSGIRHGTYSATVEGKIKNAHKCPQTMDVISCLLSVPSTPGHNYNKSPKLWKSSFLLLEEILRTLQMAQKQEIPFIVQDFLHILDSVLHRSSKGQLLYTPKNIHQIHVFVDAFVDLLVTSVDMASFNSSTFWLDLHQTEIHITKKKMDFLPNGHIILRRGQVWISGMVLGFRQVWNSSDEMTIVTVIFVAPRVQAWLVSERSEGKRQEVEVTGPILTLSASVRGDMVSLIHTFRLTQSSHATPVAGQASARKMGKPVCSFKQKNNSQSDWDTLGCRTVMLESSSNHSDQSGNALSTMTTINNTSLVDTNTSLVECQCNHTTSFAIIMSVVDLQLDAVNALALDIITYIGCGVTMVSMFIAITVFTCIRSLDSERVCVHRNLCVAILLSQFVFLTGIQAVENKVVCRLVALLLHYLYMSTFVWMLVEGLHLYSQVVRVFGTEKSRIAYYMCFGWGFPLLEVAVSAAIDWEGYGTERNCWLSVQRTTIWAFVGPALSVIFVNLLILLVVMKIIVLATKVDKRNEVDHIRAGVKASLFLSPLLGITWLFGLAAVNKDLLVFQYIFSILNSLQGFFIFLYHCVFNTDVRQTLKRMKEKRMLQRDITATSDSSQRASCSDPGTDLTPKQSTSPVFKRIRQISPEMGGESV